MQVGDGGGRDIGDVVGHRDGGRFLPVPNTLPGAVANGRRRGRAGRWRRRRGALHAGVHIGFVVVADVEHVIVALEHAGEAAEPDIGRAAIPALRDDAHIVRGPCGASAAATPVATAGALPNSECSQGTCQEVSG